LSAIHLLAVYGPSEVLQTFIRFPQTLRIFLGGESYICQPCLELIHLPGTHDNGYLSTLTDLNNEHLLGKLVMLKGYPDTVDAFQSFDLPTLKVDGLFMNQALTDSKWPSPLTITGLSSVTTNGGLISPESPPTITAHPRVRVIDPTFVSPVILS
jgi:hypothetical protein